MVAAIPALTYDARRSLVAKSGVDALPVPGFEVGTMEALSVTISGTNTPERFAVHACRSRIDSRGGADTVTLYPLYINVESHACGSYRTVIRGGPGNDKLLGTRGRDEIYGGPGFDRVDGSRSRDLCRTAERKVRCER